MGRKNPGKIIITLVFVFAQTLHLCAQAPGYMGKKTSIGYGFYINPAFAAALIDFGTNVVNTQHEFFIERAVGRAVSIGFSAKLFKSTYNNTNRIELTSLGTYSDLSPEGHYDIKGRNYAFYVKFFKSKYLAPWGKYFLLGLTYNTYTTKYDPEQMFMPGFYGYPAFDDFGSLEQNFNYADLMFGWGNSRVLRNRIILDYGYQLNLIGVTLLPLDALDQRETDENNYIQKTSISRVRGINRFNFYLKIGYLF